MKSLVLHLAVLRHQAQLCSVSLERDAVTLKRRFNGEGRHFIEVVLPRLDDLLLGGLSAGYLQYSPDFHRGEFDVPLFLEPLWLRVFDEDGYLREAPDPVSIAAIRQIVRLEKKIFEVCDDESTAREFEKFVATDLEVGRATFAPAAGKLLARVIHHLYGRLLASSDWTDVKGKHGPGAVAERDDLIARWDFGPSNPELAHAFPDPFPQVYSMPYPDHGGIPLARLVAVPKTAEKPRLISIEPSAHQFVQQGIKDVLYAGFRRMPFCSLQDQTPNRDLAWLGSIDGSLSTLDLSEASDRVSMNVVDTAFARYTGFLRAIKACRTEHVLLPSGRVHELRKFASMGSALTFPIEVMVFSAITIMACALNTAGEFDSAVRAIASSGRVRVYGDDIIVPSEHAKTVRVALEHFGLKVNTAKSFSTGLFRESCGGDFFGGDDVTPIYRRRRQPREWHDTSEIVSLVSFANLYHQRYGFSPIPDLVSQKLAEIGVRVFRTLDKPSERGFLAIAGHELDDVPSRWNAARQCIEYRVPCLVTKETPTRATEEAQLRHSLWNAKGSRILVEADVQNERHFLSGRTSSHGVTDSTKLIYRWEAAA